MKVETIIFEDFDHKLIIVEFKKRIYYLLNFIESEDYWSEIKIIKKKGYKITHLNDPHTRNGSPDHQ